jgi:hypothetical protein
MPQFLEHPVAVDTLFVSMMEDVDFPKRQEELAGNWIAHGFAILASRFVIDSRLRRRPFWCHAMVTRPR